MKYRLGLLLVVICITSVQGQPIERTAKYRLSVWGMNIGEYIVTQETTNDGDISVEAITDVKVKLIFSYRVKYIQHSSYKNGSLLKYHVQTLKNGNVNSDTHLEKSGDAYLLIKDGDSTYVHNNITYSGSLLYFNEPHKITSIYNERNGETNPIKRIANNTYAITDKKDHKTNEYKYKEGILEHATLLHPLATIHLERFF